MTVRAAWLLPGGTAQGQTREDTRLAPVGTWSPESEIRTRDGVVPGGDPFTAADAGAMSLQVGIGRAMVQGTDAQGAYPVAVDAPEVITFPDGDALFDRIDSVILRVYDQLFDANGQNLAVVERLAGAATDTPAAPDLPACSLRLWDVTVPAGASAGVGGIDWTSALSDRRRFTAAVGGIIPQGWGLSFAGAYDGQYRDAGGVLERWNAGDAVWEQYPAAPTLPLMTEQAADPPLNQTGAYVDFTASAWPRITFTVPPSGAVWVTVSGQVENRTTDASTAWITWRATGAYTEAHGGANGLSAAGGRVMASRRSYRSGLPVGGQVTIIPGWNVSSVGATTLITSGRLAVEFVQ